MTKPDIRCSTCPMMKIPHRANRTANSLHLRKPRGHCFCEHPDMRPAFDLIAGSSRTTGFIAFTRKDSDEPDIKTTPRWCPQKMKMLPVEISKIEAYQVIDKRKPLGLFFLKEGEGYTGIDNLTGDAWTEEFATRAECIKWLKGGEKHE